MYPFYYCRGFDIIEDGWQTFDLEREYRKLLQAGAQSSPSPSSLSSSPRHDDSWRISTVNKNFALCPTYPEKVIVPRSVTDDSLIKVAHFRCLGRFPVLSYLHKPNQAVIVRSGQPMVGPGNKRCKEDERLLTAVIGNQRGHIIDTRHENIAQLAKTKGGGHEPEAYYPLLRRCHKPIPRYNVLVDSLHKLIEGCHDKSSTMEKWISTLENSNWLGHVQSVLECACVVAQCIDHEGASVLVHGSEGMDSTLQVCSLAQIILDPDCRTVQGFEALIEREWLQAGHAFAARCKHSAFAPSNPGSNDKREYSPVFLLFLDCVWQLMHQFACSFEFNEDFLILLLDHHYGSEFGTFLGNCPRERLEHDFASKTTSLWSYINRPQILEECLNPVYEPNEKAIWPSVAAQSLELWESVHLRWTIDTKFKKRAKQRLKHIRAEQRKLRAEGDQLRIRLEVSSTLPNNLKALM
jgi:myotubularin-related protein 9